MSDQVEIGDQFRDLDPRTNGRIVKVLDIEGERAVVVGIHGGQKSRVKLSRLTSGKKGEFERVVS